MASELAIHKCGIRIAPPAVIIIYTQPGTRKLHRRTMPMRFFSKNSKVETVAEELRNNPRHKTYVSCIPRLQLERLLTVLKETLNGLSVEESLKKIQASRTIDPEEDLNKLSNEELRRKKEIMDESFERNRKKPGDADFQYDVDVDFDEKPVEVCGWDSDEDSDPEF